MLCAVVTFGVCCAGYVGGWDRWCWCCRAVPGFPPGGAAVHVSNRDIGISVDPYYTGASWNMIDWGSEKFSCAG